MNLSTFEAFKNMNQYSDDYIRLEGETLKKYQQVLLGIAKDIIEVCDSEGIPYQLSGGTALGAVRHGGFIPWDDDIDINLWNKDFRHFLSAFEKKYGEKYWIEKYDDPGYGIIPSKIRLKGSISRGREDIGNEKAGFTVDIFCLVNVFDNPVLRNIHGFFCMGFGFALSCRNFYKNRELMREMLKANPELRSTFNLKIGIGCLLSFASVRSWAIITEWIYGLCKNDHSKYVSIPAGRKHYFGEMYLRDGMEQTVRMPFENFMWNVARDYKAYFTALYGADFMTPPPAEKQETHILLELKFPE